MSDWFDGSSDWIGNPQYAQQQAANAAASAVAPIPQYWDLFWERCSAAAPAVPLMMDQARIPLPGACMQTLLPRWPMRTHPPQGSVTLKKSSA